MEKIEGKLTLVQVSARFELAGFAHTLKVLESP